MKYLLYPVTWLFLIIVFIRNKLYDWRVLPTYNSQIPIISIGNIQVGGAGKTPFVIALCKQLIAQNMTPLIISRGYKRNTTHQIIFKDFSQYSAQQVGDEPYYIKQTLKDVQIIIDNKKQNAVKFANQLKNINCIILDDGFQSRYINRRLDIVLIDVSRDYSILMPVGNLREPQSNLNRAHFIYTTKADSTRPASLDAHLYQQLDCNFKLIKYKNGVLDTNYKQTDELGPVITFCGIANDAHFRNQLNKMNIKIKQQLNFENHAKYNQTKYNQLKNANPNNLSFITTYKDFVKLDESFKNKYTIYVLEMNVELSDEKLINKIKELVNEN